jgi:DNA helicase-2/ATP-dependent DNA helicase PcrA
MRSGLRRETLHLRNPSRDYPEIRNRALGLLTSGHISELLRTTYARVVVDEYQDCSRVQHALLALAADIVPVVILGDPMQAIFGFAEPLAHWDDDVCRCFPEMVTLDTPWRWLNAGEEAFGRWLLQARDSLKRGDGVDLRLAPAAVQWVKLDGGRDDYQRQLRAAQSSAPLPGGSVLILADSRRPNDQRRFASQVPGASTVEAVDLKDFVAFCDAVDFSEAGVLRLVAKFAEDIMTNVGAEDLLRRVATLESGRARNPATDAESAARRFKIEPNPSTMADLLEALNRQSGTRVYRPAVLRACFHALRQCRQNPALSLGEAARRMREEHRAGARTVAKRSVGSTLLLKGLESDMAVILNASDMDTRHLYVAMTRGARRLIVCSRDGHLRPAA